LLRKLDYLYKKAKIFKMFVRLSLSILLVGIGIGSPWLVQDWLNSQEDANQADRFYTALSDFPGKLKEKLKGEGDTKSETTPENEALQREPYPLASQTRRMMHGFTNPSGKKIPFLDPSPPAFTPRSKAITEQACARLQPELNRQKLRVGNPVFLRLFKEEAELEVWMKGEGETEFKLFKVYRIAESAGVPGPKLREGDSQAPEGFYSGTIRSLRPETKHHLGIDLGYPNEYDAYHGYTGSDLMIHGGLHAAGAFALSREAMEDLYALVEAGLEGGQVTVSFNIFPFRMTDSRMDQVAAKRPRWLDFWINLKEGYDYFENVRLPPGVTASDGRYRFLVPESEN